MAHSDARFGFKANLGRDDFDLSQKRGFTSACGMLLPIWQDFATPGDAYYMQHDMPLLRSSVLASPAMIDVKVHFETFFVPIQMIYQPFENVLFGLTPILSQLYNTNLLDEHGYRLPKMDYASYMTWARNEVNQSDPVKRDIYVDGFRLSDLFGLCPDAWRYSSSSTPATRQAQTTPNFFPWQLCAYHCIYEYYYRLDDKEYFRKDTFNLDDCYAYNTFDKDTSYGLNFRVWQIHQRPWDFDYFTSIYRSPIISEQNVWYSGSVLNPDQYSDLINYNGISRQTIPVEKEGDIALNPSNAHAFSSRFEQSQTFSNNQDRLQANYSTALLRQMFANEKLAMITGRTKKNYDSQVLAHYGFNVPHDVKHDITMIHHDVYELNVQEVTSLASTSDSPLGELAGKSYAAGNGEQFKFVAPCHGVIMTIFSVEPKRRYFGGFDRINAIDDIFDLPTPEFDRLGNQPMFRYESGWDTLLNDTFYSSEIIGWKERYYAFKRRYDRSTMAFGYDHLNSDTNTWSSYMLSFRPFANYVDDSSLGVPNQRPDLEDRFYIDRGALDACTLTPFVHGWLQNASGENWNITPWLAYQRDPFIVNSYIKCKKVSWMSKDGEPIYNF